MNEVDAVGELKTHIRQATKNLAELAELKKELEAQFPVVFENPVSRRRFEQLFENARKKLTE